MSNYVRDVVNRLVNVSDKTTNKVYIMDEQENMLVPINTMNIFMDNEGRVVIIPTSREWYPMLDRDIVKVDELLR
jgi:hypothetical protein